MSEVEVTIQNFQKTFKKKVDLPLDMLIGNVRERFKEISGEPSPVCDLVLERTHKKLQERDTVQDAGLQSGDVLILTPYPQGG
jgi:hypothetical protein